MKITSLLFPILKSLKSSVHYEEIVRDGNIVHFYTVLNSKYRYDGEIRSFLSCKTTYTKEEIYPYLKPHMVNYLHREFIVVFDPSLKIFQWNNVTEQYPYDHPKQLGPIYEWIKV